MEVSEEYADGILHVTTRQDIQLHFVHLEETPDLMRRLGVVGITTHEACGNAVRNVTACHLSGSLHDARRSMSPPTPQPSATSLLGHPDAQEFGRKFQSRLFPDVPTVPADSSRCTTSAESPGFGRWGRSRTAGIRVLCRWRPGGRASPGGAVRRISARRGAASDLPVDLSSVRPSGEKDVRSRARLKFLVAKLGIEEFRRLVLEDRAGLTEDSRWTAFLDDVHKGHDGPLWQIEKKRDKLTPSPQLEAWLGTNVTQQRQPGYKVVMVYLPLGDITADQMRGPRGRGEALYRRRGSA